MGLRTNGPAAAKVLSKIAATLPTDPVACEWTKKIRLFDAKELAIAHKLDNGTAAWLAGNPDPQPLLPLALFLSSKDISPAPLAAGTLHLSPPEIETVAVGDLAIVVDGLWFGTKKPKAWMEYSLPGVGVRKLKCKVLVPDGEFRDAKGKAIYMNPGDGDSRLTLQRPAKLPKGLANWDAVTHLVVDNGAGLGAALIGWE